MIDVISRENAHRKNPDATKIARDAEIGRVRAYQKQSGSNHRLFLMMQYTYYEISIRGGNLLVWN